MYRDANWGAKIQISAAIPAVMMSVACTEVNRRRFIMGRSSSPTRMPARRATVSAIPIVTGLKKESACRWTE